MISPKAQLSVLITGVTGLVGGAVARRMSGDASGLYSLRGAVRRICSDLPAELSLIPVADLDRYADWQEAVRDVDVVIHAAARVHVMNDGAIDPLKEFRRVNVEGTMNVARQAAAAGAQRFIFVSSIKVNGETTEPGKAFTASDPPDPVDAYGISKWEAEQGLLALSAETGMEVVIIRPPLVYGPGVKANFAAMIRWVRRRVPLPLGAIHNQRSLVALDNLVDLTVTCVAHPAAAGQVFLVSDGEDVSTTELLIRMGQAMGAGARLIPVPTRWLKFVAGMVGKEDVVRRLCGSLQVDIEKTHRILGWRPPLTLDEGLKRAVGDGHEKDI